jgi:SNF2 family DNA or RNA helicase
MELEKQPAQSSFSTVLRLLLSYYSRKVMVLRKYVPNWLGRFLTETPASELRRTRREIMRALPSYRLDIHHRLQYRHCNL